MELKATWLTAWLPHITKIGTSSTNSIQDDKIWLPYNIATIGMSIQHENDLARIYLDRQCFIPNEQFLLPLQEYGIVHVPYKSNRFSCPNNIHPIIKKATNDYHQHLSIEKGIGYYYEK